MKHWPAWLLMVPAALCGTAAQAADRAAHQARAVKVTTLPTMLADLEGFGEWGYAALVEVGGNLVVDPVRDVSSLVIATAGGTVIVTG